MPEKSSELIIYQFSRAKVERGDFTHFLENYAPKALPTGRRPRAMMNKFSFCIEGYDDDPREIHSIPEIRDFYSAFNREWPYWLYFCNIDTAAFQMMVLCCLPSICSIKIEGEPNVAVEYEPREVLKFLHRNYEPMLDLCARGGVFEHLIEERKAALCSYFRLPTNSMPQ